MDRALFAAGYRTVQRPDPVQTFNCRAIDKSKKCLSEGTDCSLHAYGIAVDVDPDHNPHERGDPFSGRIPVTADEHLWFRVQTLDALRGWVASSFLTSVG